MIKLNTIKKNLSEQNHKEEHQAKTVLFVMNFLENIHQWQVLVSVNKDKTVNVIIQQHFLI